MRFLVDENLWPDLVAAVLRYNVTIDILRVGQPGAPPLGSLDPAILIFCEAEQRAPVTDNRRTMAVHERDHFAAGRHHWGILELRGEPTIGQIAQEMFMFWEASEAEEWIDRREWIPY